MSSESFKILKEINSLYKRVNELDDLQTQENKRVLFITKNREEKFTELEEAQTKLKVLIGEITKIENEINTLSLKLDKDRVNIQSLIDQNSITSMEKQIEETSHKLSENEELGLEKMESQEELETSIIEFKEFLKGSKESLDEISDEVNSKCSEYQIEKDKITKRIELLTEELPAPFKSRLEQTLSRKIQISSFTRIKAGACEFCAMALSRVDITQIEDNLALKTCQGCSRIFIPIQAAY